MVRNENRNSFVSITFDILFYVLRLQGGGGSLDQNFPRWGGSLDNFPTETDQKPCFEPSNFPRTRYFGILLSLGGGLENLGIVREDLQLMFRKIGTFQFFPYIPPESSRKQVFRRSIASN